MFLTYPGILGVMYSHVGEKIADFKPIDLSAHVVELNILAILISASGEMSPDKVKSQRLSRVEFSIIFILALNLSMCGVPIGVEKVC